MGPPFAPVTLYHEGAEVELIKKVMESVITTKGLHRLTDLESLKH